MRKLVHSPPPISSDVEETGIPPPCPAVGALRVQEGQSSEAIGHVGEGFQNKKLEVAGRNLKIAPPPCKYS